MKIDYMMVTRQTEGLASDLSSVAEAMRKEFKEKEVAPESRASSTGFLKPTQLHRRRLHFIAGRLEELLKYMDQASIW